MSERVPGSRVPGSLRIAVPTAGHGGERAPLSPRLGSADSFTLFDVENGRVTNVSVVENPPHNPNECGPAAAMLGAMGVGLVLTAAGGGAAAECAAVGFDMASDTGSPTARTAVDAHLARGATRLRG